MSYLVSENMVAGYGGANILNSCSIQVDLGQIAAVVGPNGAGKSTAMKAIFGLLPLQSGSVKVLNERINDLPPFQRVKKGMAFVPQTDNIFTSLTVEENLEMGAFTNPGAMITIIEQVYSLFPVLKEKRLQRAGELSGGQRQQVAVGRALMTEPKLLMLDEPTAGLAETEFSRVREVIARLSNDGVGLVVVAHHLGFVEDVADRVVCLASGSVLAEGTPHQVKTDFRVMEAYLGTG